ncbi:MAG TPA: carbohydrate binding domain-containing protein [Verrucomicrobiae bacterium]|nr:carbohydrate binding domain-containing protein [Verrucomicrobiae bacterium]
MQIIKIFAAVESTASTNCLKKTWLCVPHALVMGLMLQGGVAAAQNLAANPGFETGDTTGWFAFGSTVSAEATYVHSGNYAALVTNRTDTWNGIAQSFQGVLQAGQTYNISAWLLLAGGPSQTMSLTMQKVDDSGTSYTWTASGSVSTNGWIQFSGQYTFNPSGTVTSLFLYAEVPSSTNAAYFIDDLVVQPVNTTNGQCTVGWTNVFQRIDGFGASSAWDGSWTTNQADMFFSTNSGIGTSVDGTTNFAFNGIGLSLLRNRIAPDGTTWETSIMKMAQARGARVWSTPWSPPAIYKNTNSVNGGSFVSSPANYQGYANQLADYVATMKYDYGINLYAVSVQNEPDESTTYESCLWTAQQFHDFVPYLAAALTNVGVASTRIMLPEDANWNYDFSLATTTMDDSNTAAEVGIWAAHAYGATASPLNTYGKPLWETEVSTFDAFDGSISNGLYWANQIHSFLTVAQVNAWHYWWLIPYATDNESLVDTNGIPAKRMYVLGQYSRFVRPGYYRIGAANNGNTSISAYNDPNSGCFAIVAVNNNSSDFVQTFNLNGFTVTNVTPWITSGALSLVPQPTVSVTNSTFVYTLPAMSVVTFVGKANAPIPTLAINQIGSQVGLTFNGDAGWNYTLLTSTNLSNWQPLLLTNPTTMPITWADTNSISNARFYRIQLGQ